MNPIDLGKKGLFVVLGIVIVWGSVTGVMGRLLACIFDPADLTADVTSD